MSFLKGISKFNIAAIGAGVGTGFVKAQEARAKQDALDAREVKKQAAQMKAILARSETSIKAATLLHQRAGERSRKDIMLRASNKRTDDERKQRLIDLAGDMPLIEGQTLGIGKFNPQQEATGALNNYSSLVERRRGRNSTATTMEEREREQSLRAINAVTWNNPLWTDDPEQHRKLFNTMDPKFRDQLTQSLIIDYNTRVKNYKKAAGLGDNDNYEPLPEDLGYEKGGAKITLLNDAIKMSIGDNFDPRLLKAAQHFMPSADYNTLAMYHKTIPTRDYPVYEALKNNKAFNRLMYDRLTEEEAFAIFSNPKSFEGIGIENTEQAQAFVLKALKGFTQVRQKRGGVTTPLMQNLVVMEKGAKSVAVRIVSTAEGVISSSEIAAASLLTPGTITSEFVAQASGTVGRVKTAVKDGALVFGIDISATGKSVADRTNSLVTSFSNVSEATAREGFVKILNGYADSNAEGGYVQGLTGVLRGLEKQREDNPKAAGINQKIATIKTTIKNLESQEEAFIANTKKLNSDISYEDKVNIVSSQLFAMVRTELSFKLASLLQGGASGTNVSTQDFERVYESLWKPMGANPEDIRLGYLTSLASARVMAEKIKNSFSGPSDIQNIVKLGRGTNEKEYFVNNPVVNAIQNGQIRDLTEFLRVPNEANLRSFWTKLGVGTTISTVGPSGGAGEVPVKPAGVTKSKFGLTPEQSKAASEALTGGIN